MKRNVFLSNNIRTKLFISLVFVMLCAASFAQIEVRTAEDLDNVRREMGGNFIQVADIDLEGMNWTPIGSSRGPFTGTYDGGGHVIRNLTIERDGADTGLFGGINGTIRNLGIENANVTGGRNTAILLGYLVNGTVEQCYASGEVTGTHYVGGLIGFIGRGDNMNVLNSYAVGAAFSESQVGGLAGDANGGTVTNCYAAVYLNGDPEFMGGLIGTETGNAEVRGSFWDTEVSTIGVSGGGTGLPTESMIREGTYSREWDMDRVWAILDGESYPYLQWQGREPGDHNFPPDEGNPSDLVGVSGNEQVNLSWQEPSVGEWRAYNVYRNGQRIAQTDRDENEYMDRNVENYTQYSYYVTAVWEDESESRPTNTVIVTPHLPFAGGDGSQDNPFQVATDQHLNDVRFNLRSYFIQTANIDISERQWEPIGYYVSTQDNRAFQGVYNGNGHVISGLTHVDPDAGDYSFFAYLNNAELINMAFEDVLIVGTSNIGTISIRTAGNTVIDNCRVHGDIEGTISIGGLFSLFNGEMTNSYFEGTVSGSERVGGLISSNSGIVTGCYFLGNVNATGQFVGGLAAQNSNVITDSHFDGVVAGANSAGGIVGGNSGRIYNSYTLGRVTGTFNTGGLAGQNTGSGQVHYCFVDADIVGYRTVGGLVGSNGGAQVQPPPQVVITNSYVRGTVSPTDEENSTNLGGITGMNNGQLINCYSTARVTGPGGQVAGLVASRRDNDVTTNSYWDTEASGVDASVTGTPRITRQMVYPYDGTTYVGWDFEEIWQNDPNELGNDGYPMLSWQEVPDLVEPPVIDISIVNIDGVDHSVISWEGVEGALSYKVFAADDLRTADWGEPIGIVGEPGFQEQIENRNRFYRVVSSIEPPPGD